MSKVYTKAIPIFVLLVSLVSSTFAATDQELYSMWLNRGLEFVKQGDLKQARESFQSALVYKPGDAEVQKAIRMTDERMLEQQKKETNYRKHMDAGKVLLKQRAFNEARSSFSQALVYRPNDSEATKGINYCDDRLLSTNQTNAQATNDNKPSTEKRKYFRVSGFIEAYAWEEYLSGQTLLTESGALYGLEFAGGHRRKQEKWNRYYGKLFGGDVDYDGQNQAGDPVKSTVSYVGFELGLEGDIWTFIDNGDGTLGNLYLGIGMRTWNREIQSADNAIGYTEKWMTAYGTVGLMGRTPLSQSDSQHLFAKIEARLPIINREEIDFSELGGPVIELEPGKAISMYGSIGAELQWLTLSTYVQTLYFTESDVVDGVFQPESLGVIWGFQVGSTF